MIMGAFKAVELAVGSAEADWVTNVVTFAQAASFTGAGKALSRRRHKRTRFSQPDSLPANASAANQASSNRVQ